MGWSATVYALFFLEMVQSVCLAIELISDISIGTPINFYWITLYIISPITCAVMQSYYAQHITTLSQRHVWSGWIGMVSVGKLQQLYYSLIVCSAVLHIGCAIWDFNGCVPCGEHDRGRVMFSGRLMTGPHSVESTRTA